MLPQALHHVAAGLLSSSALTAVTVAACAVFAADAVGSLAVPDAAPATRDALAGSAPASIAAASPPARDPAALVARNMFCSTCVPGAAAAAREPVGMPAVLIATSLGAAPRATVRVVPTEVQGSWGPGELIAGVGRVARIGAVSIDVVDAAGHTRQLRLADVNAAVDPDAGSARPGEGSTAADPFAERVRRVADGIYEVDRALIRELVAGASTGGTRMSAVIESGEIRGLRVLGARPGSIAHAVGLRSGDLVREVDGAPIRTAQQMIDLLARLDAISEVALAGTRGGRPLALTLRLH